MNYTFKPKPEAIRSVGMAVAAYMFEAFADPRLATDPRGWAMAVGLGVAHAVGVALLALYSTQDGQQGVAPAQSPAAPVGAVQPPVGLPGERGGVLVNPPWVDHANDVWVNGAWVANPTPGNFGASDVRVGNTSGLVVQSRPALVQPSPPAPTADELRHQQRSASAQRGWATRRAAATAPPVVPDKPRARRRG